MLNMSSGPIKCDECGDDVEKVNNTHRTVLHCCACQFPHEPVSFDLELRGLGILVGGLINVVESQRVHGQ